MTHARAYLLSLLALIGVSLVGVDAHAAANVQCPGDTNGDAIIDAPIPGRQIVCKHLSAGDGFISMADGKTLYIFGFSDLTGVPLAEALSRGVLAANFTAPTLSFKEGDEVYLTLTNAGTLTRPDLFDPHTVHYHGYPNAAPVFDGEPMASIAINQQSSLTYYYNVVEPGTFMYHCHVEATEHMQMGMLGNLYVHPRQDGTSYTFGGKTFTKFAYNDGDGSTGYDVEYPIQIGSMDPVFHDLHLGVQPLPFANMKDTYAVLNGRGYPDTVNPNPLPPPAEKVAAGHASANDSSQRDSSLITATAGQKILLRISNLNVTKDYTLATMGLRMKIVGMGSHILRGPGGASLYYETNSVTVGSGEAMEALIDTTGVAPGTYFLYTTNLNYLSNNVEDFGGMMTEIRILPGA